MCSEPVEVVADLELLILRRKRLVLGAADREIAPGQQIAQAIQQELVLLELVECRAHRSGQRANVAALELLLRQSHWVVLAGLTWLQPSLDPVQAARDQGAERKVGIRAAIGRLELDVVALF